jgi:hypothetical protein
MLLSILGIIIRKDKNSLCNKDNKEVNIIKI